MINKDYKPERGKKYEGKTNLGSEVKEKTVQAPMKFTFKGTNNKYHSFYRWKLGKRIPIYNVLFNCF